MYALMDTVVVLLTYFQSQPLLQLSHGQASLCLSWVIPFILSIGAGGAWQ